MAIRLAINGFGRIGRSAFKVAFDKPEIEVVAINDVTDMKTLAYLLRYDTVYGRYGEQVGYDENHLIVSGKKIPAFAQREPANLPWRNLQIDVVVESTGKFRDPQDARSHLKAGARRVVISAPSKGDEPAPTYLIGVNADKLGNEEIIDSSSCTTNCIAPVMAILHKRLGVVKAAMTTVHAYTPDQNLHDGPHKDLRRARAAAANIVPTSTGASDNTARVIPELEGKFSGMALRVPVICGSLSDITALVSKKTSVEEVNGIFEQAADSPGYRGVLAVTQDPIVSSDVIGTTTSSIVDLSLTQVTDGDLVKVFAWYDNELAYSHRLVEQVILVGKKLGVV